MPHFPSIRLHCRWLYLALCVLLFLSCCACGEKLPPSAPQSFTSQATVTFGEMQFTAAVEQRCPGSLRLEFAGLPELEGMCMQLEGGTAIVSYQGMEITLPTPSLPQAGFAGLLNQVLQQIAQPDTTNIRRAAGGWEVTGTIGILAYTARLNQEGRLCSLEAPGAALRADLT